MKILLVNNQLNVLGGSETYMFSVGDELINKGHHVEYFGKKDPDGIHGNSFDIYATDSSNPFRMIVNKNNCKRFGELLDLFKPDIIHLNLIYFTLTPAIIYEASKRNIPIVQTIHDSKIVCPCHRFYIEHKGTPCLECAKKHSFAYCIKNRCIKGSFLKSLLAFIEAKHYRNRKTYHLIDRFIFPSKFMMDLHIGEDVSFEKAVVLNNFSRISKRSFVKKQKDKYVLYFGRIEKAKGIGTMLEACRALPNVHFVFVGIGDMVKEFQDLQNCDMVGFKSGKELEELISQASFTIVPSMSYENCPMTILESIALGTPVIGADIGGIPELVNEGKTGMTFQSGNTKELISLIEQLYYDDKKLAEMSGFCILDKSLKTSKEYVDELESIYKIEMEKKR